MDEINVIVINRADKDSLYLRYAVPGQNRRVWRCAKTRDPAKAQKAAGKWQSELREGRYREDSRMLWEDFRARYEEEVLEELAPMTRKKLSGVFNHVERILELRRLKDLTAQRLSHLQTVLRKNKMAETTIKGCLSHLRAALNWAVKMDILHAAPKIRFPKRGQASSMMRGRPITGEEFERMLEKVPQIVDSQRKPTGRKPLREPIVQRIQQHLAAGGLSNAKIAELVGVHRVTVGMVARNKRKSGATYTGRATGQPPPEKPSKRPPRAESWRHLLRGLWLSGLRLAESLDLTWEERDDKPSVILAGERSMLRILAETEKGNKDRLLPMPPDFVEFLEQTPEDQRTGYVFNPAPDPTHGSRRLGDAQVGKIISAIGEAVLVRVSNKPVKFASAHDLRRSFGARWSMRVMPQQLMELMRHESINTTLKYYVGRNSEATAALLWAAHRTAAGTPKGTPSENRSNVGRELKTQAHDRAPT